MFLSKGNSENGGSRGAYVLADFNTGIKALVQADIDVYATRIRDLEAIERRDHTPADIIEWLVQCAEDPVTRWEGAYELATESAESLDQEQSGDKPACRVVKGDPGNEPDQVKPEPVSIDSSSMTAVAAEDKTDSDEEEDSPSENLVARLTETQKERLVTSLLTTQTITEGDLKLIEVIKVWKDPRLVDFLLERLRGMEDNPPEIADQLVDHLSDIMSADEVSALADQFRDLPAAEEAGLSAEGDRRDQSKGEETGAEQYVKMREAAEKRSAALKQFLAVVGRRRRAQASALP